MVNNSKNLKIKKIKRLFYIYMYLVLNMVIYQIKMQIKYEVQTLISEIYTLQ